VRKIFPERGLAYPLETAFFRDNKKVVGAGGLCVIVALLLVPGVILAVRALSKTADQTQPRLQQVTAALKRKKDQTAEVPPEATYDAIYAAQALSGRNFQAIALPASEVSGVPSAVQKTMPTVFESLVYPGLRRDLENKIGEMLQGTADGTVSSAATTAAFGKPVTLWQRVSGLVSGMIGRLRTLVTKKDASAGATPPAVVAAAEKPPDALRRLSEFTDQLFAQEDNILLFTSLASGRGSGSDLLTLASSLSPESLKGLDRRNTSGLDMICRTHQAAFDQGAWHQKTVKKLKSLVSAVLSQSMNEENLRGSLGELTQQLVLLQKGRLKNYDDLDGLRRLLTKVQNQIAEPQLQWITSGDAQFKLPVDLTNVLDRIFDRPPEKNVLLCEAGPQSGPCANLQTLKASIEQMARSQSTQFRDDLLQFCNDLSCTLLATTDNKLQFSPTTVRLQSVLNNFLQLPFVANDGTNTLRDPNPKEYLLWDNNRLLGAIQDKQAYDKFFASDLTNISSKMLDAFEDAAESRLRPNMVDAVALAQEFRDLPPGTAPLKQATIEEARNFQLASSSLGIVLDQFADLEMDKAHGTLQRIITNQAVAALTHLDASFESQNFYWPRFDPNSCKTPAAQGVRSFDCWDGKTLPSVDAYGAASGDRMAEFLAQQRQDLQEYMVSAQPLVTFLQQRGFSESKQKALLAKWQGIVNDLQAYAATPAASGLGSLETFLASAMDKTSLPDCQSAAAPNTAAAFYFARVRAALEISLDLRCRFLSGEAAVQRYTEIADSFNKNLKGKFPFSSAPPDNALEAKPSDVADLFRQLDRDSKAIRVGLQTPPKGYTADKIKEITGFLDRMDALRPLFTSLLSGPAPLPALDFVPTFRVNRTREINGNQIIDWTLQSGENTVRKSDPPTTLSWTFGEPIKLVLRWAKDSPEQPLPPASMKGEATTRTIEFVYNDGWSLFSLMKANAAPASDFPTSLDYNPHTLVFTAKEGAPAPGKSLQRVPSPNRPAPQSAKVFIRIKIFPPGKAENLSLPPFPEKAP
jgi:hypothetical protein